MVLPDVFSVFKQSFASLGASLELSLVSASLEKLADRIDGIEFRINELEHLSERRAQIGQAHEENGNAHGCIAHAHDSTLPGERRDETVADGRYGCDREQDGREKRPF